MNKVGLIVRGLYEHSRMISLIIIFYNNVGLIIDCFYGGATRFPTFWED
jgi:hypothetical protein